MTAQHGIKNVAVGRSDVFRMAPTDLHIKPEWNSRDADFDPSDPEDLSLARSIASVGVKQPLTVAWEGGKAFVTDGHRRRGAVQHAIDHLGAEIKSVPVVTEDRYASEADRVFSQIVRNSGKALTPFEQGKVFKRLLALGWSEEEIGTKAGRSRTWVQQMLELQSAPEDVQSLVRAKRVSASLASSVMRKAGADAGGNLAKAVATAEAQGKTRATARHLGKKPDALGLIRAAFSGATITVADGIAEITMPDARFAEIKGLIGCDGAEGENAGGQA